MKVTQAVQVVVQLELYHASGKLREKSSVLSSRLKAGRVVDELTSTGRAFQTHAAMTGKARSRVAVPPPTHNPTLTLTLT